MGIFSENILSFKIFSEFDTVSEQELFRTQKKLFSKKSMK